MSVQLNPRVVSGLAAIAGFALLYLWYSHPREHSTSTVKSEDLGSSDVKYSIAWEELIDTPGTSAKWNLVLDVPDDVVKRAKDVKVQQKNMAMDIDGKHATIFVREAGPATTDGRPALLLLHGMAFSSKNWLDIGTIQLAAAMGYRVVAVDLPGYGSSKSSKANNKASAVLLVILELGLGKPVIVSPSMSGTFALPFILGPPGGADTCSDRVSGYIPITPSATESYQPESYAKCKVPVMIVYGSNDGSGVKTAHKLQNFASRATFPIADAGHPAYIDKPKVWHKLLYTFLTAISNK